MGNYLNFVSRHSGILAIILTSPPLIALRRNYLNFQPAVEDSGFGSAFDSSTLAGDTVGGCARGKVGPTATSDFSVGAGARTPPRVPAVSGGNGSRRIRPMMPVFPDIFFFIASHKCYDGIFLMPNPRSSHNHPHSNHGGEGPRVTQGNGVHATARRPCEPSSGRCREDRVDHQASWSTSSPQQGAGRRGAARTATSPPGGDRYSASSSTRRPCRARRRGAGDDDRTPPALPTRLILSALGSKPVPRSLVQYADSSSCVVRPRTRGCRPRRAA